VVLLLEICSLQRRRQGASSCEKGIFERIKEWYIQELQNNFQRKVEQADTKGSFKSSKKRCSSDYR